MPSRILPSLRHLLPTSAATAACAAAGSAATASGVDSRWYASLDKPPFQPPGWVFPVAWTALYSDLALTTAAALDRLPAAQRRRFWAALTVNLGLNAAWSWTFFAERRIALSVPVAAALTLSSADLVRRVARVSPGHATALTPYPLWCAFATALSASLDRRNPPSSGR